MSDHKKSGDATGSHFDKAELMQRLGGDTGLLQELLGYAREDFPGYLQSLEDTQESGSPEAFRRASHKLKGFARNLGFTRLAQLALEAEHSARDQEADGDKTLDPARDQAARDSIAAIKREIETLSGLIAGQ